MCIKTSELGLSLNQNWNKRIKYWEELLYETFRVETRGWGIKGTFVFQSVRLSSCHLSHEEIQDERRGDADNQAKSKQRSFCAPDWTCRNRRVAVTDLCPVCFRHWKRRGNQTAWRRNQRSEWVQQSSGVRHDQTEDTGKKREGQLWIHEAWMSVGGPVNRSADWKLWCVCRNCSHQTIPDCSSFLHFHYFPSSSVPVPLLVVSC